MGADEGLFQLLLLTFEHAQRPKAPIIPSTVVKMKPVGSYLFPGYKNFAITPATNPIMMVQRILIASSLLSALRRWALGLRYARWDGFMTRLTTMAAMPASTALAIGDFRMSMIGLDPGACS